MTGARLPAPLRLLRPQQWVKNVFVLAGVFFAGAWAEPAAMGRALAAFVTFCLASSAAYVLNDLADRESDARHPRKRERPLASGTVSVAFAATMGLLCAAAALALAAPNPRLLAVIAGYGIVNLAYSRFLKHVVLADVFCIAAGFLLRLLAGTWGIGVPPSEWFLLCGLLLSLFLGFCKRYAERMDPSQDPADKRAVVEEYTPELLRALLAVTLACTLMTYGLYAVSSRAVALHGDSRMVYTVPLVAFVLFRYLYLVVQRGFGENLSRELLRDKALLAGGILYALAVGLA